MARFKAFVSDDEDDDASSVASSSKEQLHSVPARRHESDNEESESEDSGDDSDSSMHDSELMESPPQKKPVRSTRQIWADEDEEQEEEERRRREQRGGRRSTSTTSSTSRSPSPPPRTTRQGDPTIIPWAQKIGVDAQKMHVMQTSMFRMPEEAAALKALSVQPAIPKVVFPTLPRKHNRESEGGVRERTSFAQDLESVPFRPTRKYARVDISASVVAGSEGALLDAGLSMGRSFRVGWGPGGTLVHLGRLCGPFSEPKTTANSSIITKTVVPLVDQHTTDTEHISKLLQHHLSNSPISPDADGVPFANPSPSLNFSSFFPLFSPSDRSFQSSLFHLGHALFDELDLRLGESVSVDVRNRVLALRRKAALSQWLEEAVAPTVDRELKANPLADSASIVFTHLTGNQVEKACEAAMDGGNVRLATLISQSGGDDEFKADLESQLQIWRDEKIDVHIREDVRKVYALLAGIVDVLEGSKGSGLEKCGDVDMTKGLDWKRAFGLRFWFGEGLDVGIRQIFEGFEWAWKNGGEGGAVEPVPWYKELPNSSSQGSGSGLAWTLPPDAMVPDGLYSLIKLFADPTCSLSHILTPFSFSPSPADYSILWHLYIILSRCMRVRDFADREDSGVGVRSDARMVDNDDREEEEEEEDWVEGHSPTADLLASMYALQLEQMGLVQEALFVLLHIEGSAGREKAIKDMLLRSAPSLDEWMTRGVIGSLKIPIAWINEAKAIYALNNGNVYDAYELYLTAGLYNPAHELAVLELAPDAVIRHDLLLLRGIFEKIEGHPVDGWHVRGKAFMDYVHVMNRLPELHAQMSDVDAIPDAAQALELEELTRLVPRLIAILPDVLRDRTDPRHNVAVAEMISGLMNRLDKVKPLALAQTKVQPTLVSEATRLRHIHSTAYQRFLNTIEVAS
ncbi:hypothetical protein JAAARDRAFT_34652 [Jaapia argillacea MUCL 33604]|uniref:Nuclear pore complex protein NUP96 C-terminal domain-containing protein n=1 Tax=Jaapia argillacea MUCL 33604 TaxID=933084 RepID=A0A067Q879_9AGAM|nr:hypothetical protein JAAARDRAFT_34652 [Jaapia argillacea MUCL 33604]